MKKLFVSMGLVAAGAASLHATYAPDANSLGISRMWSVSATLRGFYDDNYTTSSGITKRSSLGFEVSPRIDLIMPLQQTEFGLRYIYGLYYYQDREANGQDPIDQTHQLDLWVDHAFNERWQVKVQDSFVVAQEPELLNPSGVFGLLQRTAGNNMVNTATITLHTDWTRLFSTELGYQNTFYDFESSGAEIGTGTIPGFLPLPLPFFPQSVDTVTPSLAGLLNRDEQSAWLNLEWQLRPETMVLVGAKFGLVNYTGNELVADAYVYDPATLFYSKTIPYYSNSRDNRSYFGYIGFQHIFLPNLVMSAQGGVQYSESYNDPLSSPSIAPYAVMSLTYTYSSGNYAQIGFMQSQNATDVIKPDNSGRITQDQETSVVYASINHHLTPKLLATVIGQWQNAVFQEGIYANEADVFYDLGVNLSYSFNPHFSADIGYNFDKLNSGAEGRDFTRNRFYVGVSAAY